MVKTFLHSGKLGDIIWALPTIKYLGGGILYLRINQVDSGSILMTSEGAQSIMTLLSTQSYINDVKIYNGENITHNLDLFRNHIFRVSNISISESVFLGQKISENYKDFLNNPWITVDKDVNVLNKIIISRTNRYQHGNNKNNSFYLRLKERNLAKHGIFVGTELEYKEFEELFNTGVPYYKTSTVLDLAKAVAASKFYVGNENLVNALNESMKKIAFLESNKSSLGQYFCNFNRPDLFII